MLKKTIPIYILLILMSLLFITPTKVYADVADADMFIGNYDYNVKTIDPDNPNNTNNTNSQKNYIYDMEPTNYEGKKLLDDKTGEEAKTEYKGKVYGIFLGVNGAIILAAMIFFIVNIIKFGQNANNAQQRKQASTALLYTGIGIAILGAAEIIIGWFKINLK